MGSSNGLGWTLLSFGGVLVYAGVKGYSTLQVLENAITGKPIADNVNKQPLGVTSGTVDPQQVVGSSGTNQSAAVGITNYNQNLGNGIAEAYGWNTGIQWDSLVKLWNAESNWDNHADNPTSHAYGIPQALPYTKMPKDAWPEAAGGQSSPAAQIKWGCDYIASRYATPSVAWAFHQQNNWY